ncbi:MAG: bifunctional UDP-N-acetylglucosamine diphosphorylase/glucosamine-1-phosphate N-acetyltransferase GlmU, partial [Xanthomonadales bacterium]|nr:bifunctional UDP-N-acetylglucosamine diphosphorylase/glucosamine-1-phosphate N-acetyltransferase GlmU [Xanthomonadales bacterium]
MKSCVPKVLQTVGGRAMIMHVLETARQLGPAGVHVVHNPALPEVKQACAGYQVTWAEQAEQLGTGHAVQQALPGIPEGAVVLILYGDIPLLEAGVLRDLIATPADGLKVLTMRVADPHGYGRIVRDEEDLVREIVEQRDANEFQQAICEVNSGIIMAPVEVLRTCLANMASKNAQNEYYLTDVVTIARDQGIGCTGVIAPVPKDLEGANDRVQLAALESRYRMKKTTELMQAGVQMADPERVDVRGEVKVGRDVYIDINVILEGDIELGDGVQLGPGCVLKNCQLAAGTRVHPYSVLEGVVSLGECDIGPFARLRPGTELGAGSRVGNFVEVKNSTLGAGTKASHLSYLGDS